MSLLTVIDNYDSFTYNLVQAFGQLGAEMRVWRNDERQPDEILAEDPAAIVLSPGPGTPAEAGVCMQLLHVLSREADNGHPVPLLGVCLGHQALAAAFGAKIVRAPLAVHGKVSPVFHNARGLFAGLEQGFRAGRYHSLVVEEESIGADLEVTARTPEGLVMGLKHRNYPFYGVQFHPESILTPDGDKILAAFLELVAEFGELRKESRA